MTVTGNELPVTLGTQQPSYSIGTGTDKTCVTPDTTTSDATPAALITPSGASNPVATLFANTSASVDTVLRPTPTGVETLEQIRNSSAPQTFVWDVGLHDGQQLESLPNGDVAVINGPDTQTPPSPSWTPPSDLPDNSGASQLPLSAAADNPSWFSTAWTPSLTQIPDLATQLQSSDAHATTATDMSEDQVVAVFSAPAALDAAGTTVPTSLTAQNNKITMTVSHQGGGYAYPILADPTASDAKASRRGTYGISSNKYQLYQKQQWDESQLATGPLRPRVARRNVPWDYALTSQSTDSRAPEGSPNDGGDAHIIDWIQNAHARGLKVVLTLDDERGPSPPPDAPTYASAFKAWLNWSATSHVKLWGAWNEPNNPTVPTNDSLGHARLAADYWGMADHLCGEGRRCTVYAGEFSGIGYYSKQSRDRPTAPTQRRYIMEYRDRIIRRYYNKRNPPAWAVHDYADGVHAKDNNPNPFGAFMRPFLDSTDALGDPRLGHPHVIVLEAGVALRLAGKDTVLKTAKNGAHLQSLAAHDILNLHTNPTLHNRVDLVSYYTYLPDPPTGPFDSGLLNYPGNARDPYCPTGQQRPAWYILTGNQPSSC